MLQTLIAAILLLQTRTFSCVLRLGWMRIPGLFISVSKNLSPSKKAKATNISVTYTTVVIKMYLLTKSKDIF